MNHSSVKLGTISGTVLTMLASIGWMEIGRTVVMGAIGAVVSFMVSWFLKKTAKWINLIKKENRTIQGSTSGNHGKGDTGPKNWGSAKMS